jgi:hypothetical protein
VSQLADLAEARRVPQSVRDNLTEIFERLTGTGSAIPIDCIRDDLRDALAGLYRAAGTRLALPPVEEYLAIVQARIVGFAPFATRPRATDETIFPDHVLITVRAVYQITAAAARYAAIGDGEPPARVWSQQVSESSLAFLTLLGLHRLGQLEGSFRAPSEWETGSSK